VDLDLEKFLDRVNHDKLMAKIAERVHDKRMLKLIRAFLQAGVMENGLVSSVDGGHATRWTFISLAIENRTRRLGPAGDRLPMFNGVGVSQI